uniref:protein LURP-one-related 8-like n=1 Tax=Erigeron canadensis TaxID=72917 RepID=UPI001CB8DA41|nr:protein LURP-one-related 8-like [Erigeron canadensis]
MTKVYSEEQPVAGKSHVVLTVWKKSLLYNCNGFTVIDSNGNLVYRVDNYADQRKSDEIVLMNASGRPLFTVHRKRLSLSDNWLVYEGDNMVKPRFSVKKHMNPLNTTSLASVSTVVESSNYNNSNSKNANYEIERSYTRKCCAMYDDRRRCVAEIRLKETNGGVALGGDVFQLVVHPAVTDPAIVMAMVIVLDQMFGSSSRHFCT